MNYLPLLTSVVAFTFTVFLTRQYIQRRKIHQFLWTFVMLFYGLSAFMEFLMNSDVMGASIDVFRVYYKLAAPLVGLLGGGCCVSVNETERCQILPSVCCCSIYWPGHHRPYIALERVDNHREFPRRAGLCLPDRCLCLSHDCENLLYNSELRN